MGARGPPAGLCAPSLRLQCHVTHDGHPTRHIGHRSLLPNHEMGISLDTIDLDRDKNGQIVPRPVVMIGELGISE